MSSDFNTSNSNPNYDYNTSNSNPNYDSNSEDSTNQMKGCQGEDNNSNCMNDIVNYDVEIDYIENIVDAKTSYVGSFKCMMQVLTSQSNSTEPLGFDVIFLPYVNENSMGGMYIEQLNHNKTVLFKACLGSRHFDEFRCQSKLIIHIPDPHSFYYRIKILDKFEEEYIRLFIRKSDPNYLYINNLDNKYVIKPGSILNIDVEQTTFNIQLTMNFNEFYKTLKSFTHISSIVKIEINNNMIKFQVSDKNGTMTRIYNDNLSTNINPSNNIVKWYSLNNFQICFPLRKASQMINLYMKNDFPLVQRTTIGPFANIYIFYTYLNIDE